MTSTSIDAVVFPQDEGTGVVDKQESFASAGLIAALARSTGAAWHDLSIGSLDTTAETVDVGPGTAFIKDPSVQVQSAGASPSAPDTALPDGIHYVVSIEETQTVDLQADTSGQLHLVVDPTASDTARVVHGSAPSEPSLVIGSADSAQGGTATRSNVGPKLPADLDADGNDISDVGDVNADTVTAGSLVDRSSGTTRDVDDISPDVSVSLSGSAPDATTYAIGTVIRDSDNPGSLWYVYDDSVSGGVRRLDPGTSTNPNEEIWTQLLVDPSSGKSYEVDTLANGETDGLFNTTNRINAGESITVTDGVGNYDYYEIKFNTAVTANDAIIAIRLNGDGSATGNYGHISEDGTQIIQQSPADEWPLYQATSTVGDISGNYVISAGSRRTGIFGNCTIRSLSDTVLSRGVRDVDEPSPTEIEILAINGSIALDADPEYYLTVRGGLGTPN